jgi:tetratricopeptide (TPR) repeat protein
LGSKFLAENLNLFRFRAAIFVLVFLIACSSRASILPRSTLTTDSLDTAQAYLLRGDHYSEIQEYDHAILDYDQAVRLNPEYAEAYNNRGYVYYWKGDAAHAIADYNQAIELRPNYAYAYNNRGAAYMASGHPQQDILDFCQAIQLQPDFPQAYTNRGNAYLRTGQLNLAIADFRQAGQNPVGSLAILCGILHAGVTRCNFGLLRSAPSNSEKSVGRPYLNPNQG